jgi:hypothetical protein
VGGERRPNKSNKTHSTAINPAIIHPQGLPQASQLPATSSAVTPICNAINHGGNGGTKLRQNGFSILRTHLGAVIGEHPRSIAARVSAAKTGRIKWMYWTQTRAQNAVP